jgi:flavin-dependent dehydrogenase
VVVYGGTASGAIAAIAAAQEGVSVALLEPRRHIGGMVSGGLGQTDFGRQEVVGGMSRELYERIGKHYGQPIAWHFEPHAAEQVFRDWLAEAKVEVLFDQRLRSVTKNGGRITAIRMKDGRIFAA